MSVFVRRSPAARTADVCPWRAVLAIALTWLVAGTVSVAGEPASDARCEAARRHLAGGDLPSAIIEFRNCVQADPDNLPGRLDLGKAYLAQGNGAAAETELKRAREFGADAELVLVPLAQAYLKQGKFRALADELRPDPRMTAARRAELLVLRGQALVETNRLADADAEFIAAAGLAPDSPAPLRGQAAVALRQGLLPPAEDAARRALALAENDAESWYVLGQIQQAKRALPEALASFTRALELAPGHVPARLGRAALLVDLGRAQEALADLDRVTADAPESLETALLKSMTLQRLGDVAGARQAILDAEVIVARLSPDALRDHGPALLVSGAIELSRGNAELAATRLRRYLQLYPRHLGASKMLANAQLGKGEASAAIATLRPMLALAPEDAGLHAMLGRAYLAAGDHVTASGLFERAATLEPDTAALQADLGMAQALAGRKDEAVAVLARALQIDPTESRAGPVLAYLHLEQGRPAEALALADTLLEGDPKNPMYQNLAGAALLRLGDAEAARARFDLALASEPLYSPAEFNLAELDRRARRPAEAARRYERILAREPTSARALGGLANLALDRGNYDEAIALLEKAAAAKGADLGVSFQLLDVYLAAGRADRARDLARLLANREPQNPEVNLRRAHVDLAIGYRDEALLHLQRAMRAAGTDGAMLVRVAQGLLEAGAIDDARTLLERVAAGDVLVPAAEAALVRIDIGTGQFDAALARAARLRERQPDWPLGYVLAGEALLAKGEPARALTWFRDARERGDSAELAASMHAARAAAGDSDAALAELAAWLASHPDGPAARRAYADALYRAGRLAEARAQYETLLTTTPRDYTLANNLAWVLHDARDLAAALAQAEFAARLAPRSPAALDTLGWMLLANGRAEDAVAPLRDALARRAGDPGIRYHLAVALAALGRNSEAAIEVASALAASDAFDERAEAEALARRLGAVP